MELLSRSLGGDCIEWMDRSVGMFECCFDNREWLTLKLTINSPLMFQVAVCQSVYLIIINDNHN